MVNLDDYIWLGVTVDGQFIKRNDDIRIVQYQVGKVKLTFTGSSEWDGMDIIARFRHSSIVYDVALTSSQAEDGITEGECVIPHEITDIIGSFEMALRGENDDGLVITSDPTTFTVVETIFSGDSLGEPEPATPSILKQILDGESTRVSNEQARVTAESARVSAEATRQYQFTTAITNANAATENANDAAALAKVNVPYNEITGSIASMTDADNGAVMEELTVYGKTVQNLWVNPSGGDSGMTATPNADGSVTVVAQRSGQACPVARASIYGLQEGKTYTLIVDPPTPPQSTWPSVAVYINGSTSPYYYEGTFEMGGLYVDDQGVGFAVATIWVNSMDPINQQYRIMLVEGDTTEPWCPPGLHSVSELDIVSAGKNLLRYLPNLKRSVVNGISFIPLGDFGFLVRGTSTAPAYYNIDYVDSYDSAISDAKPFIGREVVASKVGGENVTFSVGIFKNSKTDGWETFINTKNNQTGTVPEYALKFRSILGVESGVTVDTIIYPQLEFGSTATSYEPPATSYPVDLLENTLSSLAEDAEDILTVRGDGTAFITENCGRMVFTEDVRYSAQQQSGNTWLVFTNIPNAIANQQSGELRCDKFPVSSSLSGATVAAEGSVCIPSDKNIWFGIPDATDAEDALAQFYARCPVTVEYVKEPEIVNLPPITPPILRSPTFNVWAATDVPTTIDLSYGWDASGMLNQATPSLCREGIRNLFM